MPLRIMARQLEERSPEALLMECMKRNGYHTLVVSDKKVEKKTDSCSDDMVNLSKKFSLDIDSLEFAKHLDKEDQLKDFRKRFYYPKKRFVEGVNLNLVRDENEECIYFCGQSLGLQLKSIDQSILTVLEDWAQRGVGCHMEGNLPAASCDLPLKENMAYLVGAEPSEIAVMSSLTVNIHVMISSFYQPTSERYKVLMIDDGFHSDLYAVRSHIKNRNLNPDKSLIRLKPRQGEYTIHPDDILEVIEKEGKSIALIFMEGVHYNTGQRFDIKEITRAGHKQGCIVGFDLAHAVGNIDLQLHDWNVDFAVWCTYKYLNSGPGGMGAIFCHRRHTQKVDGIVPGMRGWWGLHLDRRFTFDRDFTPAEGADRFKLSNPSPYLSCMILSNLEVFREAGNERLRQKQRLLTGYLDFLIRKNFPQENGKENIRILTPSNPNQRGSQISLHTTLSSEEIFAALAAQGIVCDKRPSVLRITPIPLYNTFTEVYQFVHILKNIWDTFLYNESPEK